MTATTAERELGAEELLLAEVMRGREEDGNSILEHPLMLAALMRRRREREDGGSILEHPLLLAALMRR
jgi:uridine kinase